MEDERRDDEQHEDAAKKKDAPGGGGAPPADDKARIKELEDENQQLKQQVADMQKRIDELEAESKAAANKARAQKLIAKLEKGGMTFASDEEREKELSRLAGLSDDAFAAAEATYDRAISAKSGCPEKGDENKDGEDANKSKADSKGDRQLRTDAGVRPLDVDDTKTSLEDKLKAGFMAAYHDRIGATAGKS